MPLTPSALGPARATAVLAALLVAGLTVLAGPPSASAATHFANCTAMHRTFPHGVGKPGARDHTSGTPVATFKRSLPLYQANSSSDRDGDGIACEQA